MNYCVEAVTEAETKVIRFQKWIITAINDYFPCIESLHICAEEEELKTLMETPKLLLGQIEIKIALRYDHHELFFKKNCYNPRYKISMEEQYKKRSFSHVYK